MNRPFAVNALSDCEVDISPPTVDFDYNAAFSRNRGLVSPDEQKRLSESRIAIVGMGGVGGIHLVTLARLGIGEFHIADPDEFELVNFNRQYGANLFSVGRNKAQVMAEQARAINPGLHLDVYREPINRDNVHAFLDGIDVLVDGIDFFEIEIRRLVFAEARRRGIWAITAGPIGFSTAYILFSPTGMSFDQYFGLNDGMDRMDQLVAFLTGLVPKATHRDYFDSSQVDPSRGYGPSAGLACQLCAGVTAAQVLKILLGRPGLRPAPFYSQFDAYHSVLRQGTMLGGNGTPWRRLVRHLARRKFESLGWKVD